MSDEMSNEEYKATQEKLLVLAREVRALDIAGFLDRLSFAESSAVMMDPTLYRAAMPNLEIIKKIAYSAHTFQQAVPGAQEVVEAAMESQAALNLRGKIPEGL